MNTKKQYIAERKNELRRMRSQNSKRRPGECIQDWADRMLSTDERKIMRQANESLKWRA